jgi:hypothetical protein
MNDKGSDDKKDWGRGRQGAMRKGDGDFPILVIAWIMAWLLGPILGTFSWLLSFSFREKKRKGTTVLVFHYCYREPKSLKSTMFLSPISAFRAGPLSGCNRT